MIFFKLGVSVSNKLHSSPNEKRVKILGCATVVEEILPIIPNTMSCEILDFGLHLIPGNLKKRLQDSIDQNCSKYDIIILGYGLCSMAVVGLQSRNCTLVVPKVDDCIAIFLGSREAYNYQAAKEPGTYYLTKGWIEVSDTILDEYNRNVEKYGKERADFIMHAMFKHYKRLVYIDTGAADQDSYRQYAQKIADHFGLKYEEVRGTDYLIRKLILGPWDEDFIVLSPGETIQYADFKTSTRVQG